ncbi:MAG: ParA family protein [Anaerolineales bacterium]|nr:ParA family protein [Anaerolineales bacterium]
MGIVISVENRKGGVAKTTTAVTLADELARRIRPNGERVLIVDTDPQGDAARALDLVPGDRCISNLLIGKSGLRENIISAHDKPDVYDRSNLYLIPASDKLPTVAEQIFRDNGAMAELAQRITNARQRAVAEAQIKEIDDVFLEALEPLKTHFRYIIIDCPPTLGVLRTAIHKFADYAIVPVIPDYHSVAQTASHTRDIQEDRTQFGAKIRILTLIPTKAEVRHTLTAEMLAQLQEVYGHRLIAEPVPKLTAVAQSPAMGGLTIFQHEPESKAAEAYAKLVDRVIQVGG